MHLKVGLLLIQLVACLAFGTETYLGSLERSDGKLSKIPDSTLFPYRAVGRLETGCSATLISSRHVLTAAHCVYSMENDEFYKDLRFSPGQDGDYFPYGTINFKSVYAAEEWTYHHNDNFDFAVIELDTNIGYQTGWVGLTAEPTNPYIPITIIGYPASKPRGTQWYSECVPVSFSNTWMNYHCETYGGMSGSGIINNPSDRLKDLKVFGVHALGGDQYNSAVRITQRNYERILSWMKKS